MTKYMMSTQPSRVITYRGRRNRRRKEQHYKKKKPKLNMEQFQLRIDIFNILKQPYVFQTTRLRRGLICNTSPFFFFCIVPHTVILNLWPDLWEKSSPIWLLSSEITPSARQQRMNSPSWDFWDDVEIANKWCRKNEAAVSACVAIC